MKIRQAQTSATYILPDPGELNKRVLIRLRVDMPADNFGVEPQYPVTFRTWAKVIQTSATTWQETAQTGDHFRSCFRIMILHPSEQGARFRAPE